MGSKMVLLDLPPEIIEHILGTLSQAELYQVLFVCRTFHGFAIPIFRQTLTFRGDPWQCRSSPAHHRPVLESILDRVLADRKLAEGIQTVNIRGWNRRLLDNRLWWIKEKLASACERLGLGDDFTTAMAQHELGDAERMTILLLQSLPNIKHLHIQPPHEGTARDIWPGASFCTTLAEITTRKESPALRKLQTVLVDCKLYTNNIGLGWLSAFSNCQNLKEAQITQFRKHLGEQGPFSKNLYLQKLIIGKRISKIWSAYYETAWNIESRAELKMLLQSYKSLKSLEINHNANIFTWVEDFNVHISPVETFEAFAPLSATLEELSFTVDCPDCIIWRDEEKLIGSFHLFSRLTSLRIQLLLLARVPDTSKENRQRLYEILPPNLQTLTILDCSRWVKRAIDGKTYSRDFAHWNEQSFMEEMTALLGEKSKCVPFLETLALGEANWGHGSVVSKLKALALSQGVEVNEDKSHYAGKLDRWFREPLAKEYVPVEDPSIHELTLWEEE